MGTPPRRPGVDPGPALGWLLLLLSALAPGRASPRLLDFPAPVCAQEVRLESGGARYREMLGPGVMDRMAEGRKGRLGCEGVGGPDSGGPGEVESPP